jgi:hypothetical protein
MCEIPGVVPEVSALGQWRVEATALPQANHRRAALKLGKIACFPDGVDLKKCRWKAENAAVPAAHQRPILIMAG